MWLTDQFTKKQLVIGAGIAMLGSLAGVFAVSENHRNQRLLATQTANNCIEKNWCGRSVRDLDLDLLPPDVKTKLDTHLEQRAAEQKASDAKIAALRKQHAEEEALRATLGDWYYGNRTDDATGKGYKIARVPSENSLNLSSPYDGEQRAYLQMRSHPRFGFTASVDIPRGQIL